MTMISKNLELELLHLNFINKSKNPLEKMQSLIALYRKLIKILFAIATKGVDCVSTKVVIKLDVLETEQNAT